MYIHTGLAQTSGVEIPTVVAGLHEHAVAAMASRRAAVERPRGLPPAVPLLDRVWITGIGRRLRRGLL